MDMTKEEVLGRFIKASVEYMEKAVYVDGTDQEIVLAAISSLMYAMDYGNNKISAFIVAPSSSIDLNVSGESKQMKQSPSVIPNLSGNISGLLRRGLIDLTGVEEEIEEAEMIEMEIQQQDDARTIDVTPVGMDELPLKNGDVVELVSNSYFAKMADLVMTRIHRDAPLEDKMFCSFLALFNFWDCGVSPLPSLAIAPAPNPSLSAQVIPSRKEFPANSDTRIVGNLSGGLRDGFLKACRNHHLR